MENPPSSSITPEQSDPAPGENLQDSFDDLRVKLKTELDLEIFKLSEELKLKKKKEGSWLSSSYAPIILSAVFALMGTGFGAWLQGEANAKLENQKFQTELVLKMIDTQGDQNQAASNLTFLLTTGLIKDDSLANKLKKLVKNPSEIPLYGTASKPEILKQIQKELQALNYYKGEIDGAATEVFTSAIKQFQKDNSFPPDGILGPVTIQMIEKKYKQNH